MANYEQIVRVTTTDQGGGSGYIDGMAAASGGVFASLQVARKVLVGSTNAVADDTLIATLAEKSRILAISMICTTAGSAADTCTVRTAVANSGTAILVATASATGTVWNVGASATSTFAAGTTLYARRTNGLLGGEIFVIAQPEI